MPIKEFPILSVNLELASWEHNDCMTEHLLKKFPFFTKQIDGMPLSIDDLKEIIEDINVHPQTIYGENGKIRAIGDYEKFKTALNWLSENFPFACVSYDHFCK